MDGGSERSWTLDSNLREKVIGYNLPSDRERRNIEAISSSLVERALDVIRELGFQDVRPILAGSVAKGTMTRDPDLDLFLLFPAGTPERILERKGLKIGRELLDGPERKYTQHPYLTGTFGGMRCDVVPCLHLPRGERIITAVDRTPHHTEYINSHISRALVEEIVLLKSFFKGIGVYGAEDTVQGFSGYLVEILALYFGGFSGTIRYLSGSKMAGDAPGGCEEITDAFSGDAPLDLIIFNSPELIEEPPLDQEVYLKTFRKDTMIVIDPVDASRNVASPVSRETLDYTVGAARDLISNPSERFFHPFSSRPHSPGRVTGSAEYDGHLFTTPLPPGDPGVTITRLRRYLRRLREELVRRGFEKVRLGFLLRFPENVKPDQGYIRGRATWSREEWEADVLIGVITEPPLLDKEYIHWGPPLHNPRVRDFNLKWGGKALIDDETCRAYTVLSRDEVRPGAIVTEVWDEIRKGGGFSEATLESLPADRVPSLELNALAGAFLPWLQ